MGQYYTPTVMHENGEMATFLSHDYGNGLKLMEHSYIGNYFVAAVLNYIKANGPARLWWLGDYADVDDFEDKEIKFDVNKLKEINSNVFDVNPQEQDLNFKRLVVVNKTKKIYIDLLDYQRGDICPIPILTAVGNGRGGGDYWGENEDKAGSWAGDVIDCLDEIPDDPNFAKEYEKYNIVFRENE